MGLRDLGGWKRKAMSKALSRRRDSLVLEQTCLYGVQR